MQKKRVKILRNKKGQKGHIQILQTMILFYQMIKEVVENE